MDMSIDAFLADLPERDLRELRAWKLFEQLPDEATLRPHVVGSLLGYSEKSLERLRREGKGPRFVKDNARRVYYQVGELRAYLAKRPVFQSTAEDPLAKKEHAKLSAAGKRGAAKGGFKKGKKRPAKKRQR